MRLNQYGKIAESVWQEIPLHHPDINNGISTKRVDIPCLTIVSVMLERPDAPSFPSGRSISG
jgi:hypothetical protein